MCHLLFFLCLNFKQVWLTKGECWTSELFVIQSLVHLKENVRKAPSKLRKFLKLAHLSSRGYPFIIVRTASIRGNFPESLPLIFPSPFPSTKYTSFKFLLLKTATTTWLTVPCILSKCSSQPGNVKGTNSQ